MKAEWILPLIILGGVLQSAGAAMNGQLKQSLINPYLASAVSFALITFFFTALFFIMPHPLPTMSNLASMPWWAPIGGLVGALQVYMGLTQVNRVGAGLFTGVTLGTDRLTGNRSLGPLAHGHSSDVVVAGSGCGAPGRRCRPDLKNLR
jgi:bacterial/archaeal transporter family-2 protein